LEFFLIPWDWISIPIPIWAQVEGFAATARLRMQMIESFPYVRNLTFTLMGVPKVDVSVQPMIKRFPNVLDLPIISSFVQSSIAVSRLTLPCYAVDKSDRQLLPNTWRQSP
jgi:Ca2+-dependent lipid-binding protein